VTVFAIPTTVCATELPLVSLVGVDAVVAMPVASGKWTPVLDAAVVRPPHAHRR
jgi:hypothetical protein